MFVGTKGRSGEESTGRGGEGDEVPSVAVGATAAADGVSAVSEAGGACETVHVRGQSEDVFERRDEDAGRRGRGRRMCDRIGGCEGYCILELACLDSYNKHTTPEGNDL